MTTDHPTNQHTTNDDLKTRIGSLETSHEALENEVAGLTTRFDKTEDYLVNRSYTLGQSIAMNGALTIGSVACLLLLCAGLFWGLCSIGGGSYDDIQDLKERIEVLEEDVLGRSV